MTGRPADELLATLHREHGDALTRYVEDQSIRADAMESQQAKALGFAMAMLQRRFASSIYQFGFGIACVCIYQTSWLCNS